MMTGSVLCAAVPASEREALFSDLQHYLRELMQYGNFAPENGVFAYPWFDAYWQEAERWPFWVLANGERAGFALVRRDEDGCVEMAEFYIRPTHRRAGVGVAFARQLLARVPGVWIISEYRANSAAD